MSLLCKYRCRSRISGFFISRVLVVQATDERVFQVHPENSEWTCYEQNASLEILSFFGFESTIEKMAMKQYSQSVAKGKEVIDYFIKELKNEGVTYVAPWQPSDNEDKETDEKYERISLLLAKWGREWVVIIFRVL